MSHNTLEELGFGLDLMYLALGVESHDSPPDRSLPPEVDEIEAALRAALAHPGVK